MANERLYLKDGVRAEEAVRLLRERIREVRNLTGGLYDHRRARYLQWADTTESTLSAITNDPSARLMPYTPRHWQIRIDTLGGNYELLPSEVVYQAAMLERMADDLEERAKRGSAAPGYNTVLDTNILLNYQWPESVRWSEIVGRRAVRLIVPLRVVEELDQKKWGRRNDLAQRARQLLSQLERAVGPGGAARSIRDGTTIEVFAVPGPRFRPQDADEEIRQLCQELRLTTGREVALITADTAQRVMAEANGIPVMKMPETYLREQNKTETASS